MRYLKDRTFRDIDHWTIELSKNLVDMASLQKKISDIPFKPLTIEEQFKMRELLLQNQVNINLLRESVNRAKSEKTTLFQRIFNK